MEGGGRAHRAWEIHAGTSGGGPRGGASHAGIESRRPKEGGGAHGDERAERDRAVASGTAA